MNESIPYIEAKGSEIKINLHPGQSRAYDSKARFVLLLAGTQGGKTSFGPVWLMREIYGDANHPGRGGGDYLAITTTYDMFKLKMLPALRHLFEEVLGVARYWGGDRILELANPETGRFARGRINPWARIILRAVSSDSGLEAATAKAAWIDECGQDEWSLAHWEAIQRRLSVHRGRCLATTTIYNRGWIKTHWYDRWASGDKDYEVISFPSVVNPAFPAEEFERARRTLEPWRFSMFYLAEFSNPPGRVYDCFDVSIDVVEPFDISQGYELYCGIDFGAKNFAAILVAKDLASDMLYIVREYYEPLRTIEHHAKVLRGWGAKIYAGGTKSEIQWRMEFARYGLGVQPTLLDDVKLGIGLVYSLHAQHRIKAFKDVYHYIDEKERYKYKIVDGEIRDEIMNKETYHMMDAERYIMTHIVRHYAKLPPDQPEHKSLWLESRRY